MTLIDQRIVIDAPPQIVWEYISDPDKVRRWHAGYRNISPLTTQPTGLGTRRRCGLAGSDKDVIEEITAWVEGLGYEYAQVEGGSFKSLRARLRLQAVPDGTSVQWTITYQPRGMMGRLRDLFGGKREMQAMMAESLRMLRRQVDELGLRMDADYRQRVSMRGRLSHEERQEFASRYEGEDARASMPEGVRAADAPPIDAIQANAAHIAEPPLPVETEAGEAAPVPEKAPEREPREPAPSAPTPGTAPSFVNQLLEESSKEGAEVTPDADTQPRPPEGWHETLVEEGVVAPDRTDAPAEAAPDAAVEAAVDAPDDIAPPEPSETPPAAAGETPEWPPIPRRAIPTVSPLYSKAPTRPLDSRQVEIVDTDEQDQAAGTPSVPAPASDPAPAPEPEAVPESHSHPTPPHGIPSVRSTATMEPVKPDAELPDEPAAASDAPVDTAPERAPDVAPGTSSAPAVEPTEQVPPESEPEAAASSAPTPPRGTPSVRRSEPDALAKQQRPAHLPPPTPKTDTGEVSIWEVFGERRPSEEDSHALEDLIESVNARETAEIRRRTRWAKRPARVRYVQREVGLRLRLVLRDAQVRGRRAIHPVVTDTKGE